MAKKPSTEDSSGFYIGKMDWFMRGIPGVYDHLTSPRYEVLYAQFGEAISKMRELDAIRLKAVPGLRERIARLLLEDSQLDFGSMLARQESGRLDREWREIAASVKGALDSWICPQPIVITSVRLLHVFASKSHEAREALIKGSSPSEMRAAR
jgi:hypothetical protein